MFAGPSEVKTPFIRLEEALLDIVFYYWGLREAALSVEAVFFMGFGIWFYLRSDQSGMAEAHLLVQLGMYPVGSSLDTADPLSLLTVLL